MEGLSSFEMEPLGDDGLELEEGGLEEESGLNDEEDEDYLSEEKDNY